MLRLCTTNDANKYSNYCYYQQDVNKVANGITESNKSDKPSDNQDNCNPPKNRSHSIKILGWFGKKVYYQRGTVDFVWVS